MTKIATLITTALKYCIDNHQYWTEEYLRKRTGNDLPYSYTDNDYNLFPRYNALTAIRQGIEYYIADDFNDFDTCKKTLITIGQTSQTLITEAKNEIEKKAIEDERRKFTDFIESIKESDLKEIARLPYRRRLKDDERKKVREELKSKWDFNGNYWFPLSEIRPDIKTIFVLKEYLTTSDFEFIRTTIQMKSPDRLYMLTEEQLDYEIETDEADVDCYETILCDKNTDMLLYGSHEGTLTFGGQYLVDKVLERLGDRRDRINKW